MQIIIPTSQQKSLILVANACLFIYRVLSLAVTLKLDLFLCLKVSAILFYFNIIFLSLPSTDLLFEWCVTVIHCRLMQSHLFLLWSALEYALHMNWFTSSTIC